MENTFLTTFVIMFREALEASLIVGIILTLLVRMKQRRYFGHVWISVITAVGVSILAGFGLMHLTASAKENMEKFIEGVISLVACGVLTYMIFWMDRQAKRIRPEIETTLEQAVTRREVITIITLPFLAVFREGAETVLFMSAVVSKSGSASLSGGLAGFLLAAGIATAIFVGGKKIPLKPLFQGSGVVLLLIAAGLLAYGIHELQEIGWIPELYAPVWNINHILNEKEGLGALLKSLFGYNGNPSLIEVTGYAAYLSTIFFFLNRRPIKLEPPAPAISEA